jgi:phosphoribosylformylglycinamidine synthase
MSPLQIWCNESQERYVMAIPADKMPVFEQICKRERAPFAVVGEATAEQHLTLTDTHFGSTPIDLPLNVLLGKAPKMHRDVQSAQTVGKALDLTGVTVKDAAERLLRLPAIAEKTFLVTIGDRTVTGLVARDQMVGPWQVPVANCGVSAASYDTYLG